MKIAPLSRLSWLTLSLLLAAALPARAQTQQFDAPPADLSAYEKVDPKNTAELKRLAAEFQGKRLLHINTTRDGGGVAEILNRMIPLLRAAGVNTDWLLMQGNPEFFDLTKAMHNAIHGAKLDMTDPANVALYDRITKMNEGLLPPVGPNDVVFVHDPQPAGLIEHFASQGANVFWRFHVDSTRADPRVLDFLRQRTAKAYATGFHMPEFFFDTGTANVLLRPSIDPLHPKNVDMTRAQIKAALARYGVPLDGKPIVSQISRYDWLKDPLGVIDAYVKLRQGGTDARLVLAGPQAVSDDPEAAQVVKAVKDRVAELKQTDPAIAKDITVLTTPYDAELINALQRASAVVLQMSTQEGFGLTVSEALWKGTPVIARPSGGIKAQIRDGVDGFLVNTPEEAAAKIKLLLEDPALRQQLGQNGREHVRSEFLITANAVNYLKIASQAFIDEARAAKDRLVDPSHAKTVADVYAAGSRPAGPLDGVSSLGDIVRAAASRGSRGANGTITSPGITDLLDRATAPDGAAER